MAKLDAEVLQPQHIDMCTLNGGFTNMIAFYVIDPSIQLHISLMSVVWEVHSDVK